MKPNCCGLSRPIDNCNGSADYNKLLFTEGRNPSMQGKLVAETGFKSLSLHGWRQFDEIQIDVHPKLTIITGANGAGKSTLLSFFTRHFGYSRSLLGIPEDKKGMRRIRLGIFRFINPNRWINDVARINDRPEIGGIKYSSDAVSTIRLPVSPSLHYNPEIDGQVAVDGIHIDSHRPPSLYVGLDKIPATPPALSAFGGLLNQEYMSYYSGGKMNRSALYHIKGALMQMSVFGYGNQTMEPIPDFVEMFKGFEDKLRSILPKSLGFKKIVIRAPEVLLSTDSGEFLIDAASGGIIKLIELTWQIYFFDLGQAGKPFVLTFDEPENHLHPSMQKSLLPNLIEAFPNAQIIVATHSPFIISAIQDSNVYVLRYETGLLQMESEDDGSLLGLMGTKVFSEKLDTINKAGTASEILRDVLGITTTIPDWAGARVTQIVDRYRGVKASKAMLEKLYQDLEAEGLASSYPNALQDITRS